MPASFVLAQSNGNNHESQNEKKQTVNEEKQDDADQGSGSILDILTPEPKATSTPVVQPAATTTATTTQPAVPEEPEDRNQPKKPDVDEGVEEVLNENLKPETPIKKNTPVKPLQPTATSTTPTTTGTTTPAAGTTGNDINGDSNSFSPNNYYIPLDNLSPAMTYTLSFIAMILGIVGAVLIIRDPRIQTEEQWAPAGRISREPLLEP